MTSLQGSLCRLVVPVLLAALSLQVHGAGQGIDPARLEAVSAAMKAQADDGTLSGIVTMIAAGGEVRQFEAHGYRDLENEVPMTTDTIFRIYSMTKPIANVALMILYDEGKFRLSDPVEKYVPEFEGLVVAAEDGPDGVPITEPAHHPMTMRELMTHTAGLTYGSFSRSQVDTLYRQANVLDRNATLADMIDKLAGIPLRQQPGSAWHYSVASDVQGHLVEVLSEMPFDVFLAQRIFEPLGMRDTGFYVPADKADRLSRMYRPGRDGDLVSQPIGPELEQPAFKSGGGGLFSTAADYMRFALMLRNDGELDGVRILEPETARLMRSPQLPEHLNGIGPVYPGNSFGLGFAVVDDPAAADGAPAGSYWWWGIGGTWFWIDPVQDVVFIGLIQHGDLQHARRLQSRSRHLLYGPLPE